ncbi:MAG: hypothetical protein QM398_09065 [Thermoproteota archaeon]|nr:hypothetical protein [Thermoproteota archaeon]
MEQKFINPLKIGLLAVVTSYFLFTLHATFVLSWIGEWELVPAEVASAIFITDVVAYIFLIFRFFASLVAFITVIVYFFKKGLGQSLTYRLVRLILVFEGLYWVGLLPSGIWGIIPSQTGFNTGLLLTTGIPCLVSSVGISVSLFVLAYKLSPNRPVKEPVKWGYITGVLYIISFWLSNTGMWMTTVITKGTVYLIEFPEAMLSLVLTIAGLIALAMFTAYYAGKSADVQKIEELGLRPIGAILVALGLYFLWNYLTWIFFGGWNEWYAWFLGHNLDLWLLSLPLIGLPLLFYKRKHKENN